MLCSEIKNFIFTIFQKANSAKSKKKTKLRVWSGKYNLKKFLKFDCKPLIKASELFNMKSQKPL